MKLDGKLVAESIKNNLKEKIEKLKIKPSLAVILVGENKASQTYVKSKERLAKEIGITTNTIELPENTTKEELLSIIENLNNNNNVNGILVQLPLPKHLNEKEILKEISPDKDVDGFHPLNAGYLFQGQSEIKPCTPAGIMKLLDYYNIQVEGKNVLVIGRSNIVGKSIASMLLDKNATVTIAHSKTKNLEELTRKSDIIIVAIGLPHFINEFHISDNTVIIDVGINRTEDGKLLGDSNSEQISKYRKNISYTPVPGGVGPLTVAMLMEQTYLAYLNQNKG